MAVVLRRCCCRCRYGQGRLTTLLEINDILRGWSHAGRLREVGRNGGGGGGGGVVAHGEEGGVHGRVALAEDGEAAAVELAVAQHGGHVGHNHTRAADGACK